MTPNLEVTICNLVNILLSTHYKLESDHKSDISLHVYKTAILYCGSKSGLYMVVPTVVGATII